MSTPILLPFRPARTLLGRTALAAALAGPLLAQGTIKRDVLYGPTSSWFGHALAIVGDLDADGADDFVVGAPLYLGGGGMIRVISGATLTPIGQDLLGVGHLGESVAAAGDLNADGVPDVLAGAPYEGAGAAYVYSGEWIVRTAAGETPTSAQVLVRVEGVVSEGTAEVLGASVLGNLNIDNDGVPDFLTGGPDYSSPGSTLDGIVRAFAGFDGHELWSRPGNNQEHMGISLAKLRPANPYGLDGMQDFAVGVGQGYVRIVSGVDGQVLKTLDYLPIASAAFGESVAALRDTTGDGKDEILIAARLASTNNLAHNGLVVIDAVDESDPEELDVDPPPLEGSATDMELGTDVAALGDVNGDGVADFAVARRVLGPYVYSGGTWSVLDTLATEPGVIALQTVAGGGDLDGDGLDDILAGDRGANWNDGAVIVYSTHGLAAPATVEEAWLTGQATFFPGLSVDIRYPAWPFQSGSGTLEVELTLGSGASYLKTMDVTVPPGPPAQRELTVAFDYLLLDPYDCHETYDCRIRITPSGQQADQNGWSATVLAHPAADFNKDQVVDVYDLGHFIEAYGSRCDPPPGMCDDNFDPLSNYVLDDDPMAPEVIDLFDLGAWAGWQTAMQPCHQLPPE